MLLSLIALIALIACIFVFKQTKRSKHIINKQAVELNILRTQYTHNLSILSQTIIEKDSLRLSLERINKCNTVLKLTNNQLEEERSSLYERIDTLETDIEVTSSHVDELMEAKITNSDELNSMIFNHIANVISHIDLDAAYESALDNYDLEFDIDQLK